MIKYDFNIHLYVRRDLILLVHYYLTYQSNLTHIWWVTYGSGKNGSNLPIYQS